MDKELTAVVPSADGLQQLHVRPLPWRQRLKDYDIRRTVRSSTETTDSTCLVDLPSVTPSGNKVHPGLRGGVVRRGDDTLLVASHVHYSAGWNRSQ